MAVTLRQLTSAIALFSGRARDKKSATLLGQVFGREMVRVGLAEPGRAGTRGMRSPVATGAQAALALLSIPAGSAPREAIGEAEILADLVFQRATRTFIADGASCVVPLALEGADRLEGLKFGDLIEILLISYASGLGPEYFYADRSTAPFGIRYGQSSDGAFGHFERLSPTPNEDGHLILDQLIFGRTYALPDSAAQRSVFLPTSLLKHVGEALGPASDARASELQKFAAQQLVAACGRVPLNFPGATFDFPTSGTA